MWSLRLEVELQKVGVLDYQFVNHIVRRTGIEYSCSESDYVRIRELLHQGVPVRGIGKSVRTAVDFVNVDDIFVYSLTQQLLNVMVKCQFVLTLALTLCFEQFENLLQLGNPIENLLHVWNPIEKP